MTCPGALNYQADLLSRHYTRCKNGHQNHSRLNLLQEILLDNESCSGLGYENNLVNLASLLLWIT